MKSTNFVKVSAMIVSASLALNVNAQIPLTPKDPGLPGRAGCQAGNGSRH